MAGDTLKFRGATLGTIARDYSVSTSAPYNVTEKKRMQSNTYAPLILPDKIIPSGPAVTQLGFSTIVLEVASKAATLAAVKTYGEKHCGKVGVITITNSSTSAVTSISSAAFCAGVSLTYDAVFGYQIAWTFTTIDSISQMTYYNELKNGGFEACDDTYAPQNWTITEGAGAIIITTPVRGTAEIGSGNHMLSFTCPDTPAATTHIKQSLGAAKQDDTTDNNYLRFSVEAMYQSGLTTQTLSYITLQIYRGVTAYAQQTFELVSNIPAIIAVSANIGSLYHISEAVTVGIIASASAAANDIIYIDNAKVEELHTTELY